MKYCTFILLWLLCITSFPQAQEICSVKSFHFGGWSKHLISSKRGDDKDWNEKHHVIGFRCDTLTVTQFKNSWNKKQYAIGKDYLIYERRNFNVDIHVGLWSGYEELTHIGIIPVITPKVVYTLGNFEINTFANPIAPAVFLGYKF